MMDVSIIVAISENGVIGKGGKIPWRLADDLKQFREKIHGHHIIMGRKTHESIIAQVGHALRYRQNVVITRQRDYVAAPGCLVVHSLEEAISLAQLAGEREAFVIGGAEIYREAINRTLRIYLTRVHTTIPDGDKFFDIKENEWLEDSREEYPANERNEFPFTVLTLDAR